jgi:hypothetical protein
MQKEDLFLYVGVENNTVDGHFSFLNIVMF